MTNLGAGAIGVVITLTVGIIALAWLRELADKRVEATHARRAAECEKCCYPASIGATHRPIYPAPPPPQSE